MKDSELSERRSQIIDELVRLIDKQTEFYRKGVRWKHTASENTEFDKRRERIRELFAELEQFSRT